MEDIKKCYENFDALSEALFSTLLGELIAGIMIKKMTKDDALEDLNKLREIFQNEISRVDKGIKAIQQFKISKE
jgi:hypothetical protein|nr:MAG TPA: Prefoldin subunit [Caudoviricetes sp.]